MDKVRLTLRLQLVLAICLVVRSSPAARFVGSGQLGPSQIDITNFASLPFTPTWTFDFETTGQNIIFNKLGLTYSGKVFIPQHHAVYLDLNVSATLAPEGYTLDINPSPGNERWLIPSYQINDPRISGVYHSFD